MNGQLIYIHRVSSIKCLHTKTLKINLLRLLLCNFYETICI